MSNEPFHQSFGPPAGYPPPGHSQGQHPVQDPGAFAPVNPGQGLPHPGTGNLYYPGVYPGAYPAGQYQGSFGSGYATFPNPQYQAQTPFFNFSNERFLKGLVIGAAAAYLLTNESVQRSAIKGAVKVWSMLQGGLEEIKERFHDAEAEIRAAEDARVD